jgi:hypothetical protein
MRSRFHGYITVEWKSPRGRKAGRAVWRRHSGENVAWKQRASPGAGAEEKAAFQFLAAKSGAAA